MKIEIILNEYNLSNILSFLDKKTLVNYDTALLHKKSRNIFLKVIQFTKFNIEICKWTSIRNINFVKIICSSKYAKYFNCNVKKLIINHKNNNIFTDKFLIYNDYIEELHIDLNNHHVVLEELIAKNLKVLTLVYVRKINVKIFDTCPNLEKIILIRCSSLVDEINFSKNIKVLSK